MAEQSRDKFPRLRFKGYTDTWHTESVSSLLTERNAQAPKSERYPLMAFIAGQGVAPKGSRYNREFLVSDERNKKYKQTEYGDFIYSSNNLETGSIGNNNYGKASISPVYSIFAPTAEGDSDFIGQLLCKKTFINEMIKWRQGVVYGQWRIHEADFLKIDVTFPHISEQKAIGAYFRELDRAANLHGRKHEKLRFLKQAMLQKLFPRTGVSRPEIRFKGFTEYWKKQKIGALADRFDNLRRPVSASERHPGLRSWLYPRRGVYFGGRRRGQRFR
jgi:type I restriction enzyme, S subunit